METPPPPHSLFVSRENNRMDFWSPCNTEFCRLTSGHDKVFFWKERKNNYKICSKCPDHLTSAEHTMNSMPPPPERTFSVPLLLCLSFLANNLMDMAWLLTTQRISNNNNKPLILKFQLNTFLRTKYEGIESVFSFSTFWYLLIIIFYQLYHF